MKTINQKQSSFDITIKHSVTGITKNFNTGTKIKSWAEAFQFAQEILKIPDFKDAYLFSIQHRVKFIQ